MGELRIAFDDGLARMAKAMHRAQPPVPADAAPDERRKRHIAGLPSFSCSCACTQVEARYAAPLSSALSIRLVSSCLAAVNSHNSSISPDLIIDVKYD